MTEKTTRKRTVKKSEQQDLPLNLLPLGASGLKRTDEMVTDEFLADLKGDKGRKMFREMADNEAIISGALFAIEMLTRQAPWEIDPADDTPQAKEVADFIQTCFEDMQGGMQGFMSEMVSTLVYGWSWFEKVHKIRRGPDAPVKELRSRYSDGKIGLRRLALRAQESLYEWQFDTEGDVVAMLQQADPDQKVRTIPRAKSLHIRIQAPRNNPEGRSLLRGAYISYYHKKHITFLESVGISRDLAGYPVMELPVDLMNSSSSDDQATKEAYRDMVQKIMRDEYEGVVLPAETDREGNPTGYRLRLLNSGGKRPTDVDTIVKRHESRMAMSFLSEFLLLGMDKVGSFALSSDKTDMFAVALGTILDVRDDAINRDVIPELVHLNGWHQSLTPTLRHGDIEKQSLAEVSAYVAALSGSGAIVMDDGLEEHLRELGSLPAPDRATARIEPEPQPLPAFGQL
jgi:hypothetical protein